MVIWGSLVLRILLAAYVLGTGNWSGGDSDYFLRDAQGICAGEWGGSIIRTPGYSWFLCALSLPGALVAQSVLCWLSGVILIRRNRKVIGSFLLWDPVFLVYGAICMSDLMFGLSVFFLALVMERVLSREQWSFRSMALLGVALAFVTLMRPIGIPFGAYCMAIVLYQAVRKRSGVAKVFFALAIALVLLCPRLYWDVTRYDRWTLATQGESWIDNVAAFVEFHGTGLDPYEAELKYREMHSARDALFPYKVIFTHLPVWLWLSMKGAARVLFGHVNVEWTHLFIGKSPIGPGWFKVPEHRPGLHVEGLWILPWAVSLLVTAAICLYVYWRTAKAWLRWGKLDTYAVWLLGSILLLTFVPQLWGDARFRLPVWPLVLLLWGWSEKRASQSVNGA